MANLYRSALKAAGTAPTGDAVAADVLTGKTFSNADGVGLSGSMPNNGAVSQTLAPGASYTIPEGYHNGSGTVTANTYTPEISTGAYATSNVPTNLSCAVGDLVIATVTTPTDTVTFTAGATLIDSEVISGSSIGIYVGKATATTVTISASGGARPSCTVLH